MSNNKKHIAIICNYDLKADRIGGMDRFYVAYDNKLKSLGHNVSWYFSKYAPFDFYKNLDIYTANDGNVEDFFLSDTTKKFDTVITHFVALCTPFYKNVKARHRAKVIAVDHNPRPINGFPIKKQIKVFIKGLLYGKYIDQFIGVSDYTRINIIKDYGYHLTHKTKTIYNGIDNSSYKKRTKLNTGKWIVASHLRESKGVQDLIRAVATLKPEARKNLTIDVYGEGPMEVKLKEQVKNLQLENIFHFRGSTSKLNLLYENYSFMIQPTYMECFSLSILESLVSNVPVVTTQVGGNLEVVKHNINGFVYPAGDVKGLHYILNRILVDGLEPKQIDVATPVIAKFNLDKMVNDHLEIL